MDERRRSTRDPTYLPGVIYFNHGRDTLSCVIRDYSYEGARIVIPSSQQVVSPNRKMHLMAAYATIVDADVRIGLIWYLLCASDLHLFPAPTLRPFGTVGAQQPL